MKLFNTQPLRALNKRSEILSKCPHRRKHLLGVIKTDTVSSYSMTNTQAKNNLNENSDQNIVQKTSVSTDRSGNGQQILGENSSQAQQNKSICWGSTRSGRSWRKDVHDPG